MAQKNEPMASAIQLVFVLYYCCKLAMLLTIFSNFVYHENLQQICF